MTDGNAEALEPFVDAAKGLPDTVHDAYPIARIGNDARAPGTFNTITAGQLRALVRTLSPAPVERREATGEMEMAVGRLLRQKFFSEAEGCRYDAELCVKGSVETILSDAHEICAAILALPCPDEAAIRADEREKIKDMACESLLVMADGYLDNPADDNVRIALSNAAVFIFGKNRASRIRAAIRNKGDAL